jgi:RimJ/RimL family protein N-acetyltransferase
MEMIFMDKIVVRQLNKKDVKQLLNWGHYHEPQFLHYNFPYDHPIDCYLWYKAKHKFFSRRIFGIYLNNQQLIGYITFKNINWLFRQGEMGIAMDPNYINRGFGTEAIKQYLDIIFNRYKMKRVYLKTAKFNQWAQACYEKVGFQRYDEVTEPFEEQELIGDAWESVEGLFKTNGIIYSKYIYFEIF